MTNGYGVAARTRKRSTMNDIKQLQWNRFGFSFERGGAHLSRTLMFSELGQLVLYIDNPTAKKEEYFIAIKEDNCLGKRSGRTRSLTARHLADLYGLDPTITIYRNLLYFWKRDKEGRLLIALLCAYARDPVLRLSRPFVFSAGFGHPVVREELEAFLDELEPGRFSKATLKSTAQNINSTWTQSGHLKGRVRKIRSKVEATPGSVAYMLLLGFLTGARGQNLFTTEYARLLDGSVDRLIELAEHASRKGWITFKRVGTVMEVLFPNLITREEMEWTRE